MKKLLCVMICLIANLSIAGTTIITNRTIYTAPVAMSNEVTVTSLGSDLVPSRSNVFSLGSLSYPYLSGYFSNMVSAKYFKGNVFGNSIVMTLATNTTDYYFGYRSGSSSHGNYNHYFGYYSGTSASGDNNTYLGSYAGALTVGSLNDYVGFFAGYVSRGLTNHYFGYASGYYAATTNSTFLGRYAGRNARGNNKLFIDCRPTDPGSSYDPINDSIVIDGSNNYTYIGRTNGIVYLRGTNFNFNGIDITPAGNFASFTFTNGTPSADMQVQIDSMKRLLIDNYSIFLFWDPGVYVMTNRLYFGGFWGSKSAAIRLCGNTSWQTYGPCRTNQDVTLDFSSYDNHGIWTMGVDGWVILDDLHIKCKTDNTDSALYDKNSAIYNGWSLGGMILAGCYFEGTSTNSGALINSGYAPTFIITYSNTFGNARSGIGAGSGATFVNTSQANQNAATQTLQYAYSISGGQVWTNTYGGITGTVGVATYPDGGNWIRK